MDENEYQNILAKLEAAYQRLQAEAGEHKEIHEAIKSNTDQIRILGADIKSLRDEQLEIKQTHAPIADFFNDIHTVSRIGRVVRAIVGWLALVVGAVAMVYVAVADTAR